jgi:signal transduction histidine kinase/DNA-binding response OmpR family regulator
MRKVLSIILSLSLLIAMTACSSQSNGNAITDQSSVTSIKGSDPFPYESYKDIPGVTNEEIAAIDTFITKHPTIIYGSPYSSYAFSDEDGNLAGYYASLAAWLGDLFGVPFELKLFSFPDLKAGLISEDIQIAPSYLAPTAFDGTRITTDVISQHAVRYVSKHTSTALGELSLSKTLVAGYLDGSNSVKVAQVYLDRDFNSNYTIKPFATKEDAEAALSVGSIDLFVADGTIIDTYRTSDSLSIGDFNAQVYQDVTLMSCSAGMQPFISVINKAIDEGALLEINSLAKEGLQKYYHTAFLSSLTPVEKSYYENLISEGKAIPIAAHPSNYPFDYYDEGLQSYQGIGIDVLASISTVTGLSFTPMNSKDASWPEVLAMVEKGELPMAAELARTPEREDRFLWSHESFATDTYAFVSRFDYPNITIDELQFVRVGLIKDTAFAESYNEWFRGIAETKTYDDQVAALDALAAGEIDLIMTTRAHYSVAVNYLKRTDFKLNYIFDNSVGSYFGFNENEVLLASIVSKAQVFVNTSEISQVWMFRVYNYQEEAQRMQNLVFGGLVALLVVALIIMVLMRRRNEHRLQALVNQRTDELAEQVAATESASKAKSSFLALMSHEMRTPLNAIIGLSQLALDDNAELEEVRENTERIYGSGVTLLHIVNDILDISKIEAGKMEIIPVNYDMASLINDTITLNILRIESKPIDFRLHVDESMPANLFGDELRVKQIMNNLLSNAFKYTQEGTVDWTLSCEREDDTLWLTASVKDTGMGIRQEDVDKLFSDYNQVDTKANRKIEGTGLGLAITKKMIELMDGTISVESTYGEGTTFTVRLRQAFVDDAVLGPKVVKSLMGFGYTEHKQQLSSQLVRVQLPNSRVLVVDDVETNLIVAKGLMKPYGMTVDCLTNGPDAIVALTEEKVHYDALFVDHMMPGMDGIELVHIIREQIDSDYARTVPIIAMTANAVMGNEEMFLSNGFDAFLAKPVEVPHLDAIIRHWVRGKFVEPETEEEGTNQVIPAGAVELDDQQEESGVSGFVPNALDETGLDWESALARFSGDEESYLEVLIAYVTHTPGMLDSLELWSEDTLGDYAITVHGVKGSSRIIGADEVGSQAEALEFAAKDRNAAFIREHEEQFYSDTSALIERIKTFIETQGTGEAKPVKDKPDIEQLKKLAAACKEADMDLIDEAMEELERFEYVEQGELVIRLREEVNQVHFLQIAELLSRIS